MDHPFIAIFVICFIDARNHATSRTNSLTNLIHYAVRIQQSKGEKNSRFTPHTENLFTRHFFSFDVKLAYPIPTSFPQMFKSLTVDGLINMPGYARMHFRSYAFIWFYMVLPSLPLLISLPPLFLSFSSESIQRKVKSVPMLSHLTISYQPRHLLKQYVNVMEGLNFKRFPEYEDGACGLTMDDFLQVKESILELHDVYSED